MFNSTSAVRKRNLNAAISLPNIPLTSLEKGEAISRVLTDQLVVRVHLPCRSVWASSGMSTFSALFLFENLYQQGDGIYNPHSIFELIYDVCDLPKIEPTPSGQWNRKVLKIKKFLC